MNFISTQAAFDIVRNGGRATRKDFYDYWKHGEPLWEMKWFGGEYMVFGPNGPLKPIRIADPDNPPSMEDVMNSVAWWHAAESLDFVEITEGE